MSAATDKAAGVPVGALVVLHDLDALAEVAALPNEFALAIVGDASATRGLPRAVTVFSVMDDVPDDAIHIRKQGRPRKTDAGS